MEEKQSKMNGNDIKREKHKEKEKYAYKSKCFYQIAFLFRPPSFFFLLLR